MTAVIVVETGAIISGANSYVSVADLTTYGTDRGVTISAANPEDLLIEAMDYIESLEYLGNQYIEDQPLSWPRSGVVKKKLWQYEVTEIPQDLIDGLCEVALAIDAGNSPLTNIERTTIREKVGDLEVEYKAGSASNTIVKKINTKLKPLLAAGNSGIQFIVSKA